MTADCQIDLIKDCNLKVSRYQYVLLCAASLSEVSSIAHVGQLLMYSAARPTAGAVFGAFATQDS